MLLAGLEGGRGGCEGRLQARLFKGQLEAQEERAFKEEMRLWDYGRNSRWGRRTVDRTAGCGGRVEGEAWENS